MKWYVASATLIASALAIPATHVLHEKREVAHHLQRRRVESEAIIPLRIALKQGNLETGYDRLMEVSHPDSSRYGQHFSPQEVHDIFAPSEEAVATVKAWLIASGIAHDEIMHYDNKGWLAVDIPAFHAEKLFGAEYHEHDFSDDSMRIGCDEYYLPAHIAEHVDFIKPGVVMSSPVKKSIVKRQSGKEPGHPYWPNRPGGPGWQGPPHYPHHGYPHNPPHYPGLPKDLQACGTNITPPCIKALYQIPDHPEHTSPENMMGLYESYDAFSQADLDLFFKNFAPYVPQGTSPKVDSVDGGTAPVPAGSVRNSGESDIDLDLAFALIYPQKITVYQVDDIPNASGATGKAGFLNTFLDAVDGSYCNYTAFGITGNSPKIDPVYPDPAKNGYKGQLECGVYPFTRVVSISYGEAEYNFPKRYLERQCSEIMKLGMQGHSLFVASGDYGVASFPGEDNNTYGCLSDNDGKTYKIYNPDWPSACPYITAVGGTRLYENQTVLDRESVMQVNLTAFNIQTGEGSADPTLQFFASGGGFSNYFPIPSYQKTDVENYLSSGKQVPSYVANAGATNIGQGGGLFNRAGRAYPDVAANGAFLEIFNNKTLLRFFGTSLASPIFASVITLVNEERTAAGKGPVGFVNPVLYSHPYVLNDVVNGSNPNCGSAGFKATTGWDPTTGLGTPNYPKMVELFMSLP